jgi:hypothetical protein
MSEAFTERYKLHYQLKKVQIGEVMLDAQFGCLNFHMKHYKRSAPNLTLAIKNKWLSGWTRA